jgi:hypothetical protein
MIDDRHPERSTYAMLSALKMGISWDMSWDFVFFGLKY